MNILVTGFDPFNNALINPSLEILKLLPNKIDNYTIHKLVLPTVFNDSLELIDNYLLNNKIDYIVSLGQAGGRKGITIERIGINIDDARIGDNLGNTPIDKPIIKDGANAYFSNLPIKALTKVLNDNGYDTSVSNTAGTFVCNHVMYYCLYLANTKYNNLKTGFIHVPYLPEQGTPNMELNTLVEAITLLIKNIALSEITLSAGKTH